MTEGQSRTRLPCPSWVMSLGLVVRCLTAALMGLGGFDLGLDLFDLHALDHAVTGEFRCLGCTALLEETLLSFGSVVGEDLSRACLGFPTLSVPLSLGQLAHGVTSGVTTANG